MKEINRDELRSLLIELLDYYVDVCESNNLRYFLGGGTILGAVRHNGFIPWDDDIDVMMPRPDYEKFIKIVTKRPNDKYSFIYYANTKNYAFTFGKLEVKNTLLIEGSLLPKYQNIGVHIDVFPIDGLPSNESGINRQFSKIMMYRDLVAIATTKPIWKKPYLNKIGRYILLYTIFRFVSLVKIMDKMETELKKFDYEKSLFVAALVGSYGRRELMTKDQVLDFELCMFEGKKYRIPVGYKKYLIDHYGDYMKLPPKEKQIGHLKREIYWI